MSRQVKPQVLEHQGQYLSLNFTPDSNFLIVSSRGELGGHSTPDGKISTTHESGISIVWSTRTAQKISQFEDDFFNDIAISPDGLLAASSNRQNICLWEIPNGKLQQRLLGSSNSKRFPEYEGLTISPDGRYLAVCSHSSPPPKTGKGQVTLIDIKTRETIKTLQAGDDDSESRGVFRCKFIADGKRLIAFSYTYDFMDQAYLWDVDSGDLLNTFEQHEYCFHLELSHRGQFLASNDMQETRLWELDNPRLSETLNWKLRHIFKGHRQFMHKGIFSFDDQIYAAMGAEYLDYEGDDKTEFSIRSWDTESGREMGRSIIGGKCYCMDISPDNRFLATMSGKTQNYFDDDLPEYILTIWDTLTGKQLAEHVTNNRKTNRLYHYPEGMRFSPNGEFLAVSHLRHVELWKTSELLGS